MTDYLDNVDLELSISGDDVEFPDIPVDTAISIIESAINEKFETDVIVANVDKHEYGSPASDDE